MIVTVSARPQSTITGLAVGAACLMLLQACSAGHTDVPPRPGLWQVTVNSTAPRFTHHTFEVCVGGKRASSHLKAIEDYTADWGKAHHCHLTHGRGIDGSYVTEANCPGIGFTRE